MKAFTVVVAPDGATVWQLCPDAAQTGRCRYELHCECRREDVGPLWQERGCWADAREAQTHCDALEAQFAVDCVRHADAVRRKRERAQASDNGGFFSFDELDGS